MKHIYLRLINVNKESWRRMAKHFPFSTDLIFLSFFSFFFFCLTFFWFNCCFEKNYWPYRRKKILTRALRGKQAIFFLWPYSFKCLSSTLLKTSFLLSHVFYNVKFAFSWFYNNQTVIRYFNSQNWNATWVSR